ncbi:MAG: hypothetical protein ING89_13465 [Rubrivivax sp.]|nr:hypothetical protein [Rubrivivax sp.]
MNAALTIRAIGVVSPIGVGFEAFSAALKSPAGPQREAGAEGVPYSHVAWPEAPARWLADFDARHWLGTKGVNALDRSTQMAVVACQLALQSGADADDAAALARRRATGVVLGSMAGGMRSIADFVRSTYTATPHMVSPMQFPNTVMNCSAGQCAIWHGLKGVNSTVCAGELSGLAALQYASRMLRTGHAQRLLAGAVEEYSDFGAWAHVRTAEPGTPVGEGAAVFALERQDAAPATSQAEPMGELLAVRVRTVPPRPGRHDVDPDALTQALAAEIGRALQQAGLDAAALAWWAPRHASGPLGELETAARRLAGIGDTVTTVPPTVQLRCGHSHAASESLRLAGALALAPAGVGLLVALTSEGQVGCALVRRGAGAGLQ